MMKLKVGGATVDFDEAKSWAWTYLNERPKTSAYPAYDGYPGSPDASVGPQDLLAVVLLNVSNNPLPVYYGLESLMPSINERLQEPVIAGDLASADCNTLEAVAHLFGVLDSTPTKYVRLTTLSKVLHRKRPHLIPLFDDNIGYCYSECEGAPLPFDGERSRAGYRAAWESTPKRSCRSAPTVGRDCCYGSRPENYSTARPGHHWLGTRKPAELAT